MLGGLDALRALWSSDGFRDRSALAAILVFSLLMWRQGLVYGHPWGDDWAGYMLQARAVVSQDLGAEVGVNAHALGGGDVQVGPDAYPWGYPISLAALAAIGYGDVESAKAIGLFSLAALIMASFFLGRLLLPTVGAVFATLFTVLQPSLFLESTYLGSDLPFVAISTWALYLTLRRLQVPTGISSAPHVIASAVAALAVGGVAFRSNGILIAIVYFSALLVLWIRTGVPRRALLRESAVFLAVLFCGLSAYFGLLPDGSLSHATYLSLDPAIWLDRAIRHFHYIATWPTLDWVRGPWKLVPFAVFLLLCVIGYISRPWEGAVLLVCVAAHIALITVFPFDGGIRYYYPMLGPSALLFSLGIRAVWSAVVSRIDGVDMRSGVFSRWCSRAGIIVFLLIGSLGIRSAQVRAADFGADAPFGEASGSVFAFLAQSAPPGARIGFFKPRAFRFLSGRVAYAIHDPVNLDRVDWYVFNGGATDTRTQVPEAALRDPANGFRIVREISPFRVYVRDSGRARANIAASGRGSP